MGCCACCMSEDGKIREILGKVEVVKASSLVVGDTKFAVGRVVQVQNQALISPVGQKPCVYYEVRCEKEVTRRDEHGNEHKSWQHLFYEERSVDFMLSDGTGAPVYVPAQSHKMKVYAVEDAGGQEGGGGFNFFRPEMSDQNPHLQALLDRHNADGRGGFFGGDGPKIRYYEGCFAVNEQVAVLGTASQTTINGCAVISLAAANEKAYSETYFEEHGWTGREIKCWVALTQTPCLIGTDDGKYMKGITIPALASNYSANALAVPIMMPMMGQQPMYQQQPMMGQQPMYQQQPMMGQQPMYQQQPMMGQQPMYQQQPMMGQQPMYQQQPMMGQQPMYQQQQPMMAQNQGGGYVNHQVAPM